MVNKKTKENIYIVEWIISNKEWIFSGLGIAIISAFFAILKTKTPKGGEGNLNVSGDKNVIGDGNILQITNLTEEKQQSNIKIVDIVIELLDARIPISSQNPDIAQIISKKKKIVVLNKGDLADDNKNKQWLEYFQKRGIPAVITDSSSGRGIDNCIKEIEKIMEEQLLLQANKGRIGRKIRAMVLGIPNVGKSSFINRISKNINYILK